MYSKTYSASVNLFKLASEIRAEFADLRQLKDNLDGTVTILIEHELSAPEIASLDAIVAAHINTANTYPAILDFTQQAGDFREIDYTILPVGLFPQRTFSQGELQLVEWFLESTFVTPIIKVEIDYVRDTFGFVQYRTTTRTWYNMDGTENPLKKITVKYYDAVTKMSESKTRRENNIFAIQDAVLTYMVMTMAGTPADIIETGRAFMDSLQIEIDAYKNTGSSALIAAIQADSTNAWLDNTVPGELFTIRDYFVQELTL